MGKNNKHQKNPMSNPGSMGREGMRIMRDIAHGKYNIYAEGHVFRNMEFVKAIIAEVNKRIVDLNIHITAIRIAYAGSTDSNVINLLYRDTRTLEAYNIISETMLSIYNSNGDVGFLLRLANQLPRYKYNI